MKTLVLFYSYTGHTGRLARALAEQEGADLAEVRELRRPGKLKAYTLGCFAALRGAAWPIQPMKLSPKPYDRVLLCSPVWAGNPPPAIHMVLQGMPEGTAVSVRMVSASGHSECRARVEAAIQDRGCTLERFEDIKASSINKE